MKFILVICLVSSVLKSRHLAISAAVADCSNCNCSEIFTQLKFKTKEFRVICKGTKDKELILNDAILSNPEKSVDHVYVRVENFHFVTIENTFLARWLTYGSSSSFDIWSCNAVHFPTEVITTMDPPTFPHQFAAVGIIESTINQLPLDMFHNMKAAGVKFFQSKADSLNIGGLQANSIDYFDIQNSTIGELKGSSQMKIKLSNTSETHEKFNIHNSHVGIIHENSFLIDNYKGKSFGEIEIKNSTIGYLKNEAISLGKKVALKIYLSNVGFVSPSSIKIDEEASFYMNNNVLGLEPSSIRNLECHVGRVVVSKNQIIPFTPFDKCSSPIATKRSSYINCSKEVLFEHEFIHQDCQSNSIISLPSFVNHDHAPPTDSINQPQIFESNTSLEHAVKGISGSFYFVIGLCIVLLLINVGLIGIFVYEKQKRKFRKLPEVSSLNNFALNDSI